MLILLNLYQKLNGVTQYQTREHLLSYTLLYTTNNNEEDLITTIPFIFHTLTNVILNPNHTSYHEKLTIIQSQLVSSSSDKNNILMIIKYHVKLIKYYINCYWNLITTTSANYNYSYASSNKNKNDISTTMVFIWKWMIMILHRLQTFINDNNNKGSSSNDINTIINQLLSYVIPIYHCNNNNAIQGNFPWNTILSYNNIQLSCTTQMNIIHCILSTIHMQDCTNMIQ